MGSRLVEENFLDENNLKSDNELFLRRKRSEVKQEENKEPITKQKDDRFNAMRAQVLSLTSQLQKVPETILTNGKQIYELKVQYIRAMTQNRKIIDSIKQIIWKFDQDSADIPEGEESSEKLINFGYNEAFKYFSVDIPLNLDFENNQNKTLLHHASQNNDLDIVQILLSQNGEVDPLDVHLITPLMLASRHGHLTVCDFLLDRGANINHQDKFKYTALNYAIAGNHLDVVKLLIEKGANKLEKNGNGLTALEFALASGDRAPIASFLASIYPFI